jgi:hypothetical protein
MTTIAFPTLSRASPSSMQWTLESNTQKFVSPMDKSVYTAELPGACWSFTLDFPSLQEADAALLQSFLAKLRGQANRFAMHNWARPTPRGTALGTPLVNNSSGSPLTAQTGATLITNGWTAGATMKPGDFFGVNSELKMCVEDSTADGAGNMVLTFEPPLRASPSHAAALTTTRPTAVFMLTEPRSGWSYSPGAFSSYSLQGIEQFA